MLIALDVGLIEQLHILLTVQFAVQMRTHLLQIQRLAIAAQETGAIEGTFGCALVGEERGKGRW